jgi:chromatin remodeling complex protein RSC6
MARTSTKAKTEQTETTTTSVQASQPVVEQTKVKVPRAKKPTTPATTTPATTAVTASVTEIESVLSTPSPVQAQVASVEDVTSESTEFTELSSMSSDFLLKLNKWVSEGNSLKTEFKALEKRWGRELKNAQKSKKRAKRGGNRSPSGFVKPTKISDELAHFLEKPLGSEMARTEVTKEINNYIRANGLQDKDNGRKIIPDNKLSGLLKISKDEELTYFNLQRYMSPHFPKTLKKPVTVAE